MYVPGVLEVTTHSSPLFLPSPPPTYLRGPVQDDPIATALVVIQQQDDRLVEVLLRGGELHGVRQQQRPRLRFRDGVCPVLALAAPLLRNKTCPAQGGEGARGQQE